MASITRGVSILIALIGISVSIEVVLSLSDFGFLENTRLRAVVYEFGGFWPGLLNNWTQNYPYQPQLMFFTYAFLHAGWWHLLMNMIIIWWLSLPILRRVGLWGYLVIYATTIVGGAVVFGLMAPDLRPMVGASGVVFGLAGALLSWAYVDRFTFRQGVLPIAQAVMILVVLNVGSWWVMDGLLAWQTHFGGFITGWIVALLVDPRPQERIDD